MAYQSFGQGGAPNPQQNPQRPRRQSQSQPGQPQQGAPQPQQPQAPQPTQTFAQMQAAGQARPAPPPPPPTPQFQPPGNGIDQQTQSAVQHQLTAPNPYGSQQVQNSYNLLSQNIDDQYTQAQRATNEQMAQRGLYDSTKAVGALSDLNIGQRDAKTQLAKQLLDQQAQSEGQYQNSAISNALGYSGQQNSQGVANYLAQLQGTGQSFSQGLQGAQFAEQQRQSDLANQLGQGQLNLGQQNLDLSKLGQQQNYGLAQQQFGLAQQGQQQQYGLAQQQQQLAQQLGLGGLGLQQQQLAQQGQQFGQTYGLQQQALGQQNQYNTTAQILQALGLMGQLGVAGGDTNALQSYLNAMTAGNPQQQGANAPPMPGGALSPSTRRT